MNVHKWDYNSRCEKIGVIRRNAIALIIHITLSLFKFIYFITNRKNDPVVITEMTWEWHKMVGKITQKDIILTNETILLITFLTIKKFYLEII